ncbi:MAG: VanZ family protein, partial [Desulfofustis sp.]|nr:VanZ family protein [Desulfofustis sp.]
MMSLSIQAIPMPLVMGIIFLMSAQPGDSLQLPFFFFGADKIAHALAYGLLAAVTLIALPVQLRSDRPRQAAVIAWLVCLCYGLSDELHQSFVPGREASFGDLLADGIGAAIVC